MDSFFPFIYDDEDKDEEVIDWTPPKKEEKQKKKQPGCICTSCNEYYEYAEPNQPDGSFKCYSCRSSGY